ncbi:hypothetical protein X927_05275 [Petrotoga mexicana DSM 14811]|uniref:Uncharacterized protein n=1 Tax=Petrotoga mexicana DSM 14811 TaxID=1122954 RepID=A0A2K1PA06_9BACT|nr:hypothetical protein [Petrotoga mexicana]PNR99620.1 hypothetical protein X927_05275 [Petrotoga mexicana DSM 14811]
MYFVGIDISKNSFHYYVSNSDRIKIVSSKLKQNMSGFITFDNILKKFSKRKIITGIFSIQYLYQEFNEFIA